MTDERRLLLNIGYRMLGSVGEAEDAVQEAFARWYSLPRSQRDDVASVTGWLVTVVSRICLDQLRSARARRERYFGEWLPEPVPGRWSSVATSRPDDPGDRVATDDSVGMALMVVLESMTPAERVAFVLHDAFGYTFAEIGSVLDRSPQACRQLASSARQRIGNQRVREVDPAVHSHVVDAFKSAWETGDATTLVRLLAPDVTAVTDGGGRVSAAVRPVTGARAVAAFCLGVFDRAPDLVFHTDIVNGAPGLVAVESGQTMAVIAFGIDGGLIRDIWAMRNPRKLTRWLSAISAEGTVRHIPRPTHHQGVSIMVSSLTDMRHKVLVVDPVSPGALDRLQQAHDVTVHLRPTLAELPRLLHDVDAIVLRSGNELSGEVIGAANRLRVIARAGAGTDNIDLGAAQAAGVQVFNVPNVSADAVAELALGLTFAVTRRIALADRQVRSGVWNKPHLTGIELAGKTMGIIGLGRIGSRIATLARGIGMNVVASVNPSLHRTDEYDDNGVYLTRTDEVLSAAHVVVLACPLTDSTRNLIGAAELDLMMPTAYLINIARGGVVDEAALYTALSRNRLAGAALDVHTTEHGDSQLANLDNVVLTPHIGAMTTDAQDRIGEIVVTGLAAALSGGDAPTRIC